VNVRHVAKHDSCGATAWLRSRRCGTADLATGRPIEGRDRFRIGSVTKIYTAAVVMQLLGEGPLSAEDALGTLLPGLVPDPEGITWTCCGGCGQELRRRARLHSPESVDVH
jgi:hypothetical protein